MAGQAHASNDRTEPATLLHRVFETLSAGSSKWWIPLLFLLALTTLVGFYAALQTDVFLTAINLRHILLATAPLALVAMAQFNVLLVRGFDISVGSMMSVTVVLASFIVGGRHGTVAAGARAGRLPGRRAAGRRWRMAGWCVSPASTRSSRRSPC